MCGRIRYGLVLAALLLTGPAEARVPRLDPDLLSPYFHAAPLSQAAEAFRLGRWEDAAAKCAAFEKDARRQKRAPAELQPARFLQALALQNAGHFDAAAALFESLVTTYPLLADHHAHQASRCHLLAGRSEAAITWASRVQASSVLHAEAVLIELEALQRLERWDKLAKRAGEYLDQDANPLRRAEARYRQALALESLGRAPSEVVPLYRRIWIHAPTESWAKLAEDRLNAILAAADPASVEALRAPSAREWFDRASELADKQRNVEAENAFAAALADKNRDPAVNCQATFHMAQAIFKQRDRSRAAPVFDQAEITCRAAADRDLTVKALYQGARCQATQGNVEVALRKYAALEQEFPDHSYADDARVRAAEIHTDKGDTARAKALLTEVPTRYPQGDMLGEAVFRLALAAYQAHNFVEAHTWLDENLRLIPHESIWYAEGRALYWKARIYQLSQKRNDALRYYERAIREYPLSVYALLSFERLRQFDPTLRASLISRLRKDLETQSLPVDFGQHPAYEQDDFRQAVELARIGLGDEARRELAQVSWTPASAPTAAQDSAGSTSGEVPIHERAQWLTSVLLDRGRVWSAAHAVPRYSLKDWKLQYPQDTVAAKWRLAYPRAFPEYVTANSRKNRVPWPLQLAIMREESAFNPTIESFANAIGLTQMLVRTAQRFSDQTVTRDTLLDPEQNITLGSRFLGFLLGHYGGFIPTSISGYNAGEAAVDRWLQERGHLELDEFLETIPYDETRGYTKRVMATLFAYHWLYQPTRPIPRLDFSLSAVRKKIGGSK